MKTVIRSLVKFSFITLLLGLVTQVYGMTREQAEAVVNDPARTQDAQTDERRNPVELLLFTGVEPGMRVADLDAGRAAWTTELMARAVGTDGVVYSRTFPGREDGLKERLAAAGLENVVPVGADMSNPLPPEATNLDVVVVLFAFHHLILQPDEARKQAYASVMSALKPGGSFIVIDTQAKDGAGPETGNTIHRLAPDLMRRELEAAGFEFAAAGDFIQNPNDPLDISGREVNGTPSAFVHRYVKPE